LAKLTADDKAASHLAILHPLFSLEDCSYIVEDLIQLFTAAY